MKKNKLKRKTVIITSGNQGGGEAVALRYAASGTNVAIIADKTLSGDMKKVHATSNRIINAGGNAITLEVNLGDTDDIQAAVEKIAKRFSGIDIVINNYSIFNFKDSKSTTPDEFNATMKNISATFFLSQSCIPFLKQSENPHIINIAPPLDRSAMKEACQQHLLFSISKYGMSFCTLGMAEEFRTHGIAFNALWQARPIATRTLMENFSEQVVRGSNQPEVYAEAAYLISLKPAREFTGNFCIDEEVLREAGIDPSEYAVDPTAKPTKDIFLPGVDYATLKLSN